MVKQKIVVTGGKIPDTAFDSVLKTMSCAVKGKKETPALQLDFENGNELIVFGIDKVSENGDIPAFMKFGKFVDSLLKLEVDCYIETDTMEFSTSPSLIGYRLWLQPIEGKQIGDTEQKYIDWIVTRLEKPGKKLKSKSEPTPAPAAEQKSVGIDEWIDILPQILDIPKDTLGVINTLKELIPNEAARKPYADSRSAVFKKLKEQGMIVEKDSKFEWVG